MGTCSWFWASRTDTKHLVYPVEMGTPIARWFTMKRPPKMDDLGVPPF